MGVFSHNPVGPSGFKYPYELSQSCRFNDDDSANIYRTFGSPTNNKIFTYSTWVKRGNRTLPAGVHTALFTAFSSSSNWDSLYINGASDHLSYYDWQLPTDYGRASQMKLRDVSSWYHIVLTIDTTDGTGEDRQKLYVNGVRITDWVADYGDIPLDHTPFMNQSGIDHHISYYNNGTPYYGDFYLAETHFVDGQALTPSSFGETKDGIWVPINPQIDQHTVSSDETSNFTSWANSGSNPLNTFASSGLTISSGIESSSTWGAAVTGQSLSITAGEVYEINYDLTLNSGEELRMNWADDANGDTSRGPSANIRQGTGNIVYLYVTTTDATGYIRLINRTQADTNYAFTLNSVKKMTGSGYGVNGFHLDYSNSAHFGEDQSGNNNDFTDSGLATNDQVPDSPTENYCVSNLNTTQAGGAVEHYDGNLQIKRISSGWRSTPGTFGVYSGKWYWEVLASGGASTMMIGAGPYDANVNTHIGENANGYGYYGSNGYKYNAGGNAAYGDSFSDGEYLGVALDMDSGKIWFRNEGVWQNSGDPVAGTNEAFSGITGTIFPYVGFNSVLSDATLNFGQHAFNSAAPTGFQALNWTNVTKAMGLNESLHLKGNKGFDVDAYEGTGAEHARSELEFSPDLVWIKDRDAGNNHAIFDTVRGATLQLKSDVFDVEATNAQGVKSFDANGVTLGTSSAVNDAHSYVAWNWREDPNYGFDIVAYEGTGVAKTEAHNLGVVPEMIIVKNRDVARNWSVYHHKNTAAPETEILYLNLANATSDDAAFWNDVAPTSSVFTVGTASSTNENGQSMIAYLFASVKGYSKAFSYTGNGSADGPFVDCGFRPRYVFIKNTAGTNSWWILDAERNTYNVANNILVANASTTESGIGSVDTVDFVASGFKIRTTSGGVNGSTNTIVGMAFAETPFPWANAR